MSVVFVLAGAGICPTPSRAQLANSAAIRDAATPPNRMPPGKDRNELQPLGAGYPVELKAAIDDGPTAFPSWETNDIHSAQEEAITRVSGDDKSEVQGPGFCRVSPPWTGRHVLGGVTVSEVTFNSGLHLAPDDQQKIASSIRQHTYFGDPDGVAAGILERVRAAWQDHGFFKARVDGDTRILADNPLDMRIALVIHIVKALSTGCNKLLSRAIGQFRNAQVLRKLFPLQDGELFSRSAIGQGLDNLRTAYRSSGFINFTSIPNSDVDEKSRSITLAIDIDEGKQFLVSSVKIVGLDESAAENALKDLALKRGEVYNEKLAELFLLTEGAWLPSGPSPESRIHMALNERAGTVALAFDFAPCPVE